MDRFADAIRKIGSSSASSRRTSARRRNALPADGFAAFLLAMRDRGFSEQDVDADVETESRAIARITVGTRSPTLPALPPRLPTPRHP